jgi:hypothetical protein
MKHKIFNEVSSKPVKIVAVAECLIIFADHMNISIINKANTLELIKWSSM